MASFMSFCAGFMMGMGFILSMTFSLLGPVFSALSIFIVFMELTTKDEVAP